MLRQKSAVRQAQIKKAVLDIISKEGLHRVSTRNVARRVGITDGTIFRHFKSKREILRSIMNDVQTGLMAQLRSIAAGNARAEERLYQFLYTHLRYVVEHPGIAVLLSSEAAHLNYKGFRTQLRLILSEQKSLISGIVSDGVQAGTWKDTIDVDDASSLCMGILITFNVKMFLSERDLRAETYCRHMFNLIAKLLS